MSYSTVYGLWPWTPKRRKLAEFRNAWGMAPVVWDAMAQRHLGAPPHGSMMIIERLWPLHEDPSIPLAARALLRMTFDHGYIAATDARRAIDDIAIFLHAYQAHISPQSVNHWPAFAELLIAQREDPPPAFGVHQTSVSENPWDGPYNAETEEYDPFDWSNAFSVYEGLV